MLRAVLIASVCCVTPVLAQEDQTLADIRQELTVLNVEIQKLRRELSTTGSPSVSAQGGTVLDRVTVMEEELRRLTSLTETLENRINSVVADGTNRIGDLEFRLVELEGGDISQLGETSTLGGEDVAAVAPPAAPRTQDTGTQLAVSEQQDFETASAALEEGNFVKAATLFFDFNQTYPGSPLAAKADLSRGKALKGAGDIREAARAYLSSFSGDATGPDAPEALYELGASLGALGQYSQACVTLNEVGVRFNDSPFVNFAEVEMTKLSCP